MPRKYHITNLVLSLTFAKFFRNFFTEEIRATASMFQGVAAMKITRYKKIPWKAPVVEIIHTITTGITVFRFKEIIYPVHKVFYSV